MNIQVPSVPAPLRITQTMWEDFLCDPVMALQVICGITLDAFQAARLRYYWWIQNVIDSSGVSTGKTIIDWGFLVLRSVLIPDHKGAIYYPVFETGKNEFWTYFERIKAPMFRAQLGQADKLDPGEELAGDGTTHGSACYKAFFRNGNQLLMPAPSFMKDAVTQASLRLNTLVVEEWTHVDAMSDGIDKQLLSRNTKPSWNQYHPIWGNHTVFSAHAQTRMHPSYDRYAKHQRRCNAGDPTYANISYSYKDYSNLPCRTGKSYQEEYRIDATIQNKKNVSGKADWSSEGLGLWGMSGVGWFSEEMLLTCMATGRARGVVPVTSRRQYEEVHGL